MQPRNVLLVYPQFLPHSFWVFTAACEALGRRCPAPPLGLITMAALLPPEWSVRLIDRNAEELTEADLAWADLVMTGGMLVQQRDTLDIIQRCHAHGVPVAIGGPDVTTSRHLYEAADYQVMGEVEPMMADFVRAVDRGETSGVFEAERYTTDITTVPVPRFDLLNLDHYLRMSVQFSRGCPFTCEFCEIIELFGRVPRVKTPEQMLAELDALLAAGWRGHVDFVDDNLIGNKKALKAFLPQLTRWLEVNDYPFEFSTQVTVNVADDKELLAMMRAANFFVIFLGIESTDEQTLAATKKKQNTRRDLAANVHSIYASGMFVFAGFIVGFDAEAGPVAGPTMQLIEEAAIPVCMVGLLNAFPDTQLARRLEQEGRLSHHYKRSTDEEGDHCTEGLNFTTRRPRREIMEDCRNLIAEVYQTDRYFARIRRVARMLDCRGHRVATPLRLDIYELTRLAWYCLVRPSGFRVEAWRSIADCLRYNPRALRSVLRMTLLYLHLGPFSRYVIGELDRKIELEAGREQSERLCMVAESA